MPIRIGLFGAVLVTACASSGGAPKPATPGEVMCVDEATIGSHIVETHCYTQEEIEAREDRTRAALERVEIRYRQLGRERRDDQ